MFAIEMPVKKESKNNKCANKSTHDITKYFKKDPKA